MRSLSHEGKTLIVCMVERLHKICSMPPTSTSLGLRPIPGPDPVPLPDHSAWLWLIPVVLLAGLVWWWRRPVAKPLLTPLEALETAIDETQPLENRFSTVDRLLREYLAWRSDARWLTTASQDMLPLWEALFAEDAHESSRLKAGLQYQWYQGLDQYRFGQEVLSAEQLTAYFNEVGQLITHVEALYEKHVKGTTLGLERNKTGLSDE